MVVGGLSTGDELLVRGDWMGGITTSFLQSVYVSTTREDGS